MTTKENISKVAAMTPEQMSLFLQDVGFMMEEMANAPKEEFGKRQPGERCMYEIQRSVK